MWTSHVHSWAHVSCNGRCPLKVAGGGAYVLHHILSNHYGVEAGVLSICHSEAVGLGQWTTIHVCGICDVLPGKRH